MYDSTQQHEIKSNALTSVSLGCPSAKFVNICCMWSAFSIGDEPACLFFTRWRGGIRYSKKATSRRTYSTYSHPKILIVRDTSEYPESPTKGTCERALQVGSMGCAKLRLKWLCHCSYVLNKLNQKQLKNKPWLFQETPEFLPLSSV